MHKSSAVSEKEIVLQEGICGVTLEGNDMLGSSVLQPKTHAPTEPSRLDYSLWVRMNLMPSISN